MSDGMLASERGASGLLPNSKLWVSEMIMMRVGILVAETDILTDSCTNRIIFRMEKLEEI